MATIKTNTQQQTEQAETVNAAQEAADAELAAKASGEEVVEKAVSQETDSGDDGYVPTHTEDEWAALLDDDTEAGSEDNPISDADAEVKEEVKVEETAPEVEAEAEEPEVAEEAAKPDEPTAEETPSEEPEVEIPVAEPEQPQETRTAEEIQTELTKAREEAQTTLTEQFKLTDEQAEKLISDPNEVLPQLAANLYLDLFDSMMQGMQAQIPSMVNQVLQQRDVKQAADKAFFGAWPQLAKPEYRQTIDRIANNYQQLNPTADKDAAIKEIGAQAWVALRLPLDELLRHTGQATAPVPQPAPASTPANVSRIPANAGSAPVEVPKPDLNEFGMLAEEFLLDDKQ